METSMKKILFALLTIAALSGAGFVVQSVLAPNSAAAERTPPDPC
jgi:hypothetical protein